MDGYVVIGTKINNSGFEEGMDEIEKEGEKESEKLDKVLSGKLGGVLNKAINKISGGISKGISKTMEFGSKVAGVLGGAIKKVLEFTSSFVGIGALTGILGAVGASGFILMKALERANGETGQLRANLSYIGFVASKIFENLLSPAIDKTTKAVNGLAGALYKVIVYIGYILSKWTGRNLLEGTDTKAYAKSMEEADKSAKKTAKSTKQIKKDLMGFDEVNKLSEKTSSGSRTGGSKTELTMPNLPSTKDILKDMPGWVEWIAKNKDTILKVTGALLGLLAFNKVVSWLAPLGNFFKLFTGGGLGKGLSGAINSLAGIALQIGAIAVLCQSVYEWQEGNRKQRAQLNKMAERGVELAEEDVKENKTLAETTEFLNYKRKQGNELLKKSHSAGAKLTGTTKEILKNAQAVSKEDKLYIDQQMEKFRKGELTKEQQEKLIQLIKDEKTYNKGIREELEKKKMSTNEIKDIQKQYNGYLEEMGIHVETADEAWNFVMDKTLGVINKTNTLDDKTKKVGDNVLAGVDALNNFNNKKINDKTAKINVEANTSKANKSLGDFIKGIGTKISDAFKKIDLGGLGKNLADAFKKAFPNVVKAGSEAYNKIKNAFKTTKAREGGIINVPGKGVPIGTNIIGGEAGPEAILPLNDTTMDRLGSSIAKHMNVSLTNITEMNGRTISRELKKVMNENNFSYNG